MNPALHINADWFDGRSARPQGVEVWIEGERLYYGAQTTDVAAVTWPERQRHGQRQVQLPQGGLLAFADAGAFDAWAKACGIRDSLVVRWQQSWRLVALAVLLSFGLLLAAWRWGVPWAADAAVQVLPPAAEQAVGESVLRSLDRGMLSPSRLSPAQQQDWMQRWAAVTQRAGHDGRLTLPRRFEIHFRDGGKALGPNALALPGGDIVITDALLELLADEPDAVLTILGHELGHVQHHHGMRAVLRAGTFSVVTSIIVGDFSALLASAPALLATNDYSRDAEREADAYARTLARAGGVDPARIAVFFERLAKLQAGIDEKSFAIAFSSHPADAERVRFFSER